jgi:hypothetical protein
VHPNLLHQLLEIRALRSSLRRRLLLIQSAEGATARDHNVGAEVFDDGPKPLRWLLGQLENCTDILPGRIASALERGGEVRLGMRQSYGAAAQQLGQLESPG